jgi:hypothetical protein
MWLEVLPGDGRTGSRVVYVSKQQDSAREIGVYRRDSTPVEPGIDNPDSLATAIKVDKKVLATQILHLISPDDDSAALIGGV